MQPMGRRPVKFPGKIDHHPPKGSVNWWEAELSTESKKTERANGKKEIAKAMTESDDALMLRVAREEIKRQAAEIEYLKARLEVSAYHPYDGIVSRDATIKLLDGRIAELQADAARYRYIRTHRIGVKWCELYAGGPLLDGVIDEMMTDAGPSPISSEALRARAEMEE